MVRGGHARPSAAAASARALRDADYETLFSLTATPTLEVRPGGQVAAANKATTRLLELDPRHVVGESLTTLLGEEAAPVLTSAAPVDIRLTVADEPVSLRLFGVDRAHALDGPPNRIVQMIRREGRAGQDAARRGPSAHMSLVDDIGHNLGTPLAIVAGYAETLGERWSELGAAELDAATGAIRRHAQRAVEELRSIQARVRAVDGGAGMIPTNMLLAWLRRMLAGPLAATGSVIVERRTVSHVTVDGGIARQALLSICQALLGAAQPAAEIVIDVVADTDGTTFVVTGVGFGELRHDHRDMLEVTASVVRDAGGRFDSDPGAPVHRVQLPRRTSGSRAPARITVALIEDDPDAAALVRASLHPVAGVFELVADERTLRAGVTAVAATQPRILVLDRTLPDGDGTQAISRIRRLSPHTTVVVLSARRPDVDLERLGPGVRWLEKGRGLADLGNELLRVLAAP